MFQSLTSKVFRGVVLVSSHLSKTAEGRKHGQHHEPVSSKLRFHGEQGMLYTGLYCANKSCNASIWNTRLGAACTLENLGVVRTQLASMYFTRVHISHVESGKNYKQSRSFLFDTTCQSLLHSTVRSPLLYSCSCWLLSHPPN